MKNLFKRALSVAAATALLMTSVISASAAPGHSHNGGEPIDSSLIPEGTTTYTITLSHPDGETSFDTNSHYGAYQIFSGTVPDSEDDENYKKPLDNSGDTNQTLPITDIKWGSAFCSNSDSNLDPTDDTYGQENILKFIYALYSAPNGTYDYAFTDFDDFKDYITLDNKLNSDYVKGSDDVTFTVVGGKVTAISNIGNVNYDKLAVEVADIIASHADSEWLQKFNDILGGFGQGTAVGKYANPGYVNRFYEGNAEGLNYKITVPAGYYMIRDLSSLVGTDKSYSARMLFVANDIKQELKESVPTLHKNVVREDKTLKETEAAGVGDEVNFRLTGTLPSNYDLYVGGYQYKFTDTLSKGLTLKALPDDPMTYVTVTVNKVYDDSIDDYVTGPFTIKADSVKEDVGHTHENSGKAYVENYDADKNELTVTFPCLKEILISDKYTLGDESEIYVEYTAIVNDDAAVKPKDTAGKMNGNTNTAVLTYSDNPQSYGDTDDTTEDTATVYSFGLDITKIDAAAFIKGESDILLNGAQFVILRNAADGNYEYATVINKGDHYAIDEWSTATIEGANGKALRTAIDGLDEKDDMAMTTDASGKLNITGLDADVEYTLVEIKTPGDDGDYAFIEPITFTINAEIVSNEYTGKISSVTETAGFSADETVSVSQSVVKNSVNTENAGIEDFTVVNFKYTDLPSTGGIGVYIYYIAGGCIVALAVVLFALSKKKKTTK